VQYILPHVLLWQLAAAELRQESDVEHLIENWIMTHMMGKAAEGSTLDRPAKIISKEVCCCSTKKFLVSVTLKDMYIEVLRSCAASAGVIYLS